MLNFWSVELTQEIARSHGIPRSIAPLQSRCSGSGPWSYEGPRERYPSQKLTETLKIGRDPKGNVIFSNHQFSGVNSLSVSGSALFQKVSWNLQLNSPVLTSVFCYEELKGQCKTRNKSQSFYDKKRCRCNHSQGKRFCPDMGCAWNLSKIQKGATLRARLNKQKYRATISEGTSAKISKSPSYWYTWSHFSPAKYSVRTCFSSNLFLRSVSVGVDLCIY